MRIASSIAAAILLFPLAACTPFADVGSDASSSAMSAASVSSASASPFSGMIEVDQPKPGATVANPLIVTGRARGNWYFEASFPVKLIDADGNQIAIEPAQAQGDWMTTEFVPFSVKLNFSTSAKTGVLVLEKDNPSGLPENDAKVEIPVTFAE